LPWLNPAQIVADECHLSLAETWTKVINYYPDSRLLGLTATPCRLDGKPFDRKLGGLYDVLVHGPKVSDLIKWGNLANYKYFCPPVKFRDTKIRKKGFDWDAEDLEAQLLDPVVYGDVIKHYEHLSKGKPAIGFCPTVKSAQKYAEEFTNAGYRAISLDGNTDDAIRRESLQELGRGELDVIFSVSLLIEGTDVPYATTAILLRRTESEVIFLQSIGRVLRPHPLKDFAIILDFVGNFYKHGYPCDDREWSLSGTVKNKSQNFDRDIKLKTCENCGMVYKNLDFCPGCGWKNKPRLRSVMKEDKTGELILIDRINKQQQEVLKVEKKQERAKAKTLQELLMIEKMRGYKKGWAYNVHRARLAKKFSKS
jgi:superfamily II DNA or RNA helicase